MGRLPPAEIRKAWHVLMQNGRCLLCGEPLFLTLPTRTFGAFSFEHKLPRCAGGEDHRRNLAGTHHECNKGRLDRLILKRFRPEHPVRYPREFEGDRRVVRSHGIWWSHFKLYAGQLPREQT